MPTEQIFIGLMTAALCGVGLIEFWFSARLTRANGLPETSVSARPCGFSAACSPGVIFGLSLALGIVNPIRWD
ncbi:MAG: hypothetical protein R3C02_23115 [Planctomycetaceae bacterium]